MRLNRFHFILLLTVIGYGLFEYYRPKPLDWSITYSNKDKIPYGTAALFELLPEMFEQKSITTQRIPIYNTLKSLDSSKKSNYLFINKSFSLDHADQDELLRYADRGNNVFISAYIFPDSLMQVLDVAASEISSPDSTTRWNFENKALKSPQGYAFPKDDGRNFFTVKNTKNVTLLGSNTRNQPIYLKVRYGKGNFYLHSLPIAFTNYYVLSPSTSTYAFSALSYLPPLPTFWDEYEKQGRLDSSNSSVLRYIASEPALSMAWYVAVLGLIVYVAFAGKRKQKTIPVKTAPKNKSLDFVKTIGNMYYRKGDHANVARKRIQYFNIYIWEKLGIHPENTDKEHLSQLIASKGGFTQQQAADLLNQIAHAETAESISAFQLFTLNNKIEAFYINTR